MAGVTKCLVLSMFFTSFVLAQSDNCDDDSKLEACAANHGYGLSFKDVLDMMADQPELIRYFYCASDRMQTCLGSCDTKFRTSTHGHVYSMCLFKRDIFRYRRCWTESFPDEAYSCYRYHYPDRRTQRLYPTPMRLYSMSSIERSCFADESDADCKYYKSLLLWNLMPTYYQTHSYPEEYRSLYI